MFGRQLTAEAETTAQVVPTLTAAPAELAVVREPTVAAPQVSTAEIERFSRARVGATPEPAGGQWD